jgi:flavodoxin short chain
MYGRMNMGTIQVVYWSGTGNTKAMAESIAKGARASGAQVDVIEAEKADQKAILAADAIALGCPAMGAEVLEESCMEPLVTSLEKLGLAGKALALFGSYDWGDGQWMREWRERMEKAGAKLSPDDLIIQNTPDADGLIRCEAFGARLAGKP